MSTGFLWIAVILILGGVIATVGDRLGTRVGKARLSLFKMRPRRTATFVTIITGSIISASTWGILLTVDQRLRTGVFEIGRIQKELGRKRVQLDITRQQLEATNKQKTIVEQELVQARTEQKQQQIEAQKQQAAAQKRLAQINQSLRSALSKQIKTQAQLNRTKGQLGQITSQFQKASSQLGTVSQQARKLRVEIKQSQTELQKLIAQRNELKATIAQRDRAIALLDQEIGQRDRAIASRNLVIARREARLKQLEKQQQYLEREALILGSYLQQLRQGNFALFRGQVLADRVVRIIKRSAAREAVDEILREANRTAIELTQPGVEQVTEQVVQPSELQVKRLISQIDDGRDYYVQILSANNYLVGEKSVQILTVVNLNQRVFPAGYVLARITANPKTMTAEELRRRVELLLGASKFSAQQAGIMGDTIQVADNRIQTLIRFLEQLGQYNQAVELKAIATEDTYTAGPLKVELLAVEGGRVLFSTQIEHRIRAPLAPTPKPQLPSSIRSTPRRGGEGEREIGPQGQRGKGAEGR